VCSAQNGCFLEFLDFMLSWYVAHVLLLLLLLLLTLPRFYDKIHLFRSLYLLLLALLDVWQMAEIKRGKMNFMWGKEKPPIFYKLVSYIFRPVSDHCEGSSSTCKEKCIKIRYCMYRQVNDACKKITKAFFFYARLLNTFLLQSPY